MCPLFFNVSFPRTCSKPRHYREIIFLISSNVHNHLGAAFWLILCTKRQASVPLSGGRQQPANPVIPAMYRLQLGRVVGPLQTAFALEVLLDLSHHIRVGRDVPQAFVEGPGVVLLVLGGVPGEC